MQGDLAVGVSSKPVAALFQFAALALEIVKLTIHNDVDALIFVGDWLVSRLQIDDAQTRMPQPDALILRKPCAVAVRAAVVQSLHRPGQCLRRDRFVTRKKSCYAAHK